MFEYNTDSSKAAEKLDRYDLTDVLKDVHGVDVYEVAEKISSIGNAEISEAIDCLTIDELVLYLERRYEMGTTEEVRSFMWWRSKY